MTEQECLKEIEALLNLHNMSYKTPVGQMKDGLAFRSSTANVIIPNPADLDATQRKVLISRLKEQLGN